jgi:peptide/nickel transport system permease protein
LGVIVIVFMLVRVIPGDPAGLIFSPGSIVSPEALARIRHEMGLDMPIWRQFLDYLGRALQGNLGTSYQTNTPVLEQILRAAPTTVELTVGAMIVAILLGVTAGVVSAVKQYSPLDYGTIFVASIGMSAPVFWMGLVLIVLFAVGLGWLPASGRVDSRAQFVTVTQFYLFESLIRGDWTVLSDSVRHLILPSIALGFNLAAMIARMTRSCMLDVIKQDYVTTARAKGLAERVILLRHTLRNALLPIVTILGLQLGYLLSGAVFTETVFNLPGLGTLLVRSIFSRDYPTVQGVVLFISVVFVLLNLLVDLLYAHLDPRVRYA